MPSWWWSILQRLSSSVWCDCVFKRCCALVRSDYIMQDSLWIPGTAEHSKPNQVEPTLQTQHTLKNKKNKKTFLIVKWLIKVCFLWTEPNKSPNPLMAECSDAPADTHGCAQRDFGGWGGLVNAPTGEAEDVTMLIFRLVPCWRTGRCGLII